MELNQNLNEALMEAIAYFEVNTVEECLKRGADPNYVQPSEFYESSEGQPDTPLRLVIFRISDTLLEEEDLKKFAEIAKILLSYGADPKPAIELAEQRYGKYNSSIYKEGDWFLEVYKTIAESPKL